MAYTTLRSTANERRLLIRVQLLVLTLPGNPANLRSLFLNRLQPPVLLRQHNPPNPLFRKRYLERTGGSSGRRVRRIPAPARSWRSTSLPHREGLVLTYTGNFSRSNNRWVH